MVLVFLLLAQAPVQLHTGLVITRSVRITPKVYRISGPIIIRGDNITVDFAGAMLDGRPAGAAPDVAGDSAIVIDGGTNVRIRRAVIRGYRIAILARGTRRLTLDSNVLSDNWKPRLFSQVEHESLVDWLSFHHNEQGEWLRFGAAIYLDNVKGGELRSNSAAGGMNGLLLNRTDSLLIRDNNFSFNSGLGVGLYRSSDNAILHNRLDFNVRGYSHGRYTRGQDSANLLLYEQSCRNVVAYNSLTHGGDGVFLWAGQTTMDGGVGGANDNLFYGNDVSYATANGIEATFSRNTFVANKAWGSEYGVWGGFSYESKIVGNDFRGNRTGVAIEHGQDNVIMANRFDHDSTAIRLWADSITASGWGYPEHRDTRSRDYAISDNVFAGNRTKLDVRNTTGLTVDTSAVADTSLRPVTPPNAVSRLITQATVPSSEQSLAERSAIVVDEWGPYDWRTPKLWPLDSTRAVPLRLATLGPRGTWRVVGRRGTASVSASSGKIGEAIVITPKSDSVGDWQLTLESRGRRFSYGRFEPRIDWRVQILDSTVHWPRLDLMYYRPSRSIAWIPAENWSLVASGSVFLTPGIYTLRTISDDAVRVWVDESLVIDNWTPHESQVDVAPIAPGRHQLRVEYVQKDGWVELRVEIVRGRQTGKGSPGPH
jgi:hypothetical protein